MLRILDEGRDPREAAPGATQNWNYEGLEVDTEFPRHHYHLPGHELQFQSGFSIREVSSHPEQKDWEQTVTNENWGRALNDWYLLGIRVAESPRTSDALRQRLANANDYFRRKASEVYTDQEALDLLSALYQQVVVDISKFDACSQGISLSKLTAANFCEVGAKTVFITEAGQRFVDTLRLQGHM